LLKRTPESGTV